MPDGGRGLGDEKVSEILRLHALGLNHREIAEESGVARGTVYKILSRSGSGKGEMIDPSRLPEVPGGRWTVRDGEAFLECPGSLCVTIRPRCCDLKPKTDMIAMLGDEEWAMSFRRLADAVAIAAEVAQADRNKDLWPPAKGI